MTVPRALKTSIMLIQSGVLVLAIVTMVAAQQPASSPGAALTRGARLVYSSGGVEQPAWVVDSIDVRASWGGKQPCSYIRFGATDVRRLCLLGDTLFSWSDQRNQLIAIRPIGAGMSLRLTDASGNSVHYETGTPQTTAVSGYPVLALPTTVTTIDRSGRTIRRLRERYSLGLATALDGIFEVPDSTAPGRWLVQREFVLVRIEPGRQ